MLGHDIQRSNFSSEGILPPLEEEKKIEFQTLVLSSPVVSSGRVCFGSAERKVYGVNWQSGEVWEYSTESGVRATPCIWQGKVYVATARGFLHAISLSDGEKLWDEPLELGGACLSSPVVDNGKLFLTLGGKKQEIIGVDVEEKRVIWRYPTLQPAYSSPCVFENRIYAGACDSFLYCLSTTGEFLWKKKTGSSILKASPVCDSQRVYAWFGDYDKHVYSFLHSGSPAWSEPYLTKFFSQPRDYYRYPCTGSGLPAVDEEKLYIPAGFPDHQLDLYALNKATGEEVWKTSFSKVSDYKFLSSPAVTPQYLFIPTIEGKIYVLDKEGNVVDTFSCESEPIRGSLAIAEGRIFVVTEKGTLYVLRGSETAISKAKIIPKISRLGACFSNPTSKGYWIPYQIGSDVKPKAEVRIKIFNSLGQLVRSLNLGKKPPGYYIQLEKAAYWDGCDSQGKHLPSGNYFYQLEVSGKTFPKRVLLLK
jgi:hypothetical protein